ncbi:MAG: UDP-N-acetylmuramoyl-L-alanyl-D-glutamate--2,6-diaminopimelate ligase [Bacilli bacterium]|jgi:UDP-N-acetylmuramoyl-L-alanyl-D-glutamate--2,6-diaminopimelate ligase|nr:UDP-N-acetylmuramoyl-L-alanyl-D-glutamate--2,6-diaminopimelate ligase [Bacilli bacterium]HHU24613.1 UDP-N-acetylmuramoyl-L-alanyl-D-glutamate--2,6-diaminopimelate ligase [Acholeplasmataceae bacterium]
MKIKELYPMLTYDHEISSIVHHSQEVYENAVFVAIVGYNHDGHDFIFEAIAKGAKTIIHEKEWFYPFPQNVNFHRVENAQKELAWLLQQVYSSIWDDLTVIGITGTNGKTTVSTMVYHYLTYLDYPTLLIGSNGCKYVDYYWPLVNTTPDIVTIYRLVKQCKAKLKYVIIEVSSQAIRELRIQGIQFDLVAITNISQDHFDYHHTWDDYLFSKGLLLTKLKPAGIAIVKREMPFFSFFNGLTINPVKSFGKNLGDIRYQITSSSLKGLKMTFTHLNTLQIESPLTGEFNAENIACFYTICIYLSLKLAPLIEFLKDFGTIKGRMEQFPLNQRLIVIDYAHTPEAVKQVAVFLKTQSKNRLFVVLGCGGERDRLKRPLMLRFALENAEWVYITEDNSRSEAFEEIVADMTHNQILNNYTVIPKRSLAIKKALEKSTEKDTIAIIGMGSDWYTEAEELVTDEIIVKRMGEIIWS